MRRVARQERLFFSALFVCAFGALFGSQLRDIAIFLNNGVLHDNFHVVTPEKFYRSAAMRSDRLARTVKLYAINTVIDLRAGAADPDEYGQLEPAFLHGLGVTYQHVPIIGSRLPSRETMNHLMDVYDSSRPPILVHDSSGTHRAGVASAVWLLAHENAPVTDAKKQLALRYGFFRYERAIKSWLQGHATIDNVVWQYACEEGKTGVHFRTWINTSLAISADDSE